MLINTRHTAEIVGDAEATYQYLADVQQWSAVFTPTIFALSMPISDRKEHIRIWATANEEVRSWTSERNLDPENRRIDFRQTTPQNPLKSMRGRWEVQERDEGLLTVVLLHEYELQPDVTTDDEEFVATAVQNNSVAELNALKEYVELAGSRGDKYVLRFSDTKEIDAPAHAIYAFLDEADQWAHRLPHVADVEFERRDEVQHLRMVTTSPDGEDHVTASIRIADAEEHRIAYKQQIHPPLFISHVGRWEIRPTGDRSCAATSHHTVVLNPGHDLLKGGSESLVKVRELVRHSLGTNSRTTLEQAAAFV